MRYLREFRFLIVVYILALLVAGREIYCRIVLGNAPTTFDLRASSGSPVPPAVKVLTELYPESPKTAYYQGVHAFFSKSDIHAARLHFERAVNAGIISDEQLLYLYAVCLILDGANEDLIDDAVNRWRRNYPTSREVDPRELIAKGKSQPAAR